MTRIRETRRALQIADRRRWEAFDDGCFDGAAYDRLSAELRRARADHRSAVAAYRAEG